MKNDNTLVLKAANNLRILIASMVEKAKSGHPGGALGGSDFLTVLYSEYLRFDPQNPTWPARDRFFLDPGHMSTMLYSINAMLGRYSMEDLASFRQWGSVTPGHPEICVERGIENTSGPLGQGHTFAVGAAIAAKFLGAHLHEELMQQKIYAYISDGGVQEEISQGSGRIAGNLGLDNLIMFYDSNDVQLSTETKAVTCEDVAMKYKAWGWRVLEIDGHNIDEIRGALDAAQTPDGRPTLIIGRTIMGKGALRADGTSYEACCATHGAPLGGDAYINTIKAYGGNPEDPFHIFPDVQAMFDARLEELGAWVAEQHAREAEIFAANPGLQEKYDIFFSGRAPKIDWSLVSQKANDATRSASAAVLGVLAQQVPNMVVASADLSNSDKTDGFLKKTHAFTAGDFSGAFLQAGVAELTMACLCIGMSLHGGVIPACATFFVFSDYMKPAVRMAALMEQPVKFIWSHDSFRVGEDGPTHEPVEQEAQIRLMEKLHNHSGRRSMLVLRPCDAHETTECYKLMMENTETPSAIILTRQNVKDLPVEDYSGVACGGYVVSADKNSEYVLVASGSEASTLCDVADILRQNGKRVTVVSVPSEGLFRSQSFEYQVTTLDPSRRVFGLTAGLPCTLDSLVAPFGTVFGLESFGFSAPYKVLDEKLGFTPEQVANKILNN